MSLFRRVALCLSALGAVFFVIGLAFLPTRALAADDPTVVAPAMGKAAIPVHDDAGRWSWRLSISDSTEYIGSWEKRDGFFASPAEAVAAVEAMGKCRAATVQTYFAEFPTRAEFNTAVGLTSSGSWSSSELDQRIDASCSPTSDWSDDATPGFRDAQGNWTVEIPYAKLGAGTHQLFMVGVDYSGSYVNPSCRRTFADLSWVGYDCIPTIGKTTTFTVIVPKPPANIPVLQGPVVDAGSFFDQSIFSGLKPIDPAKLAPALVAGGGATMVLGALVAFPSMLISSAVDKFHARASRRRRLAWLGATISGPWAIVFLFAAAIIAGFSDPNFGINWSSLRTLVTVFLVFMLMNVGSTFLAWRLTRKHNGQEYPELTAKPFFLLIVAGTVAFARITHIDPAMVFGSVLALELGRQISEATEAVISLIVTVYTFTIGLVAWVLYSWLASIHLFVSGVAGVDAPPTSRLQVLFGFGQVTVGEFMSVLTIEAFSTIPLALLPIAGLGGETLFAWKKWVWGVIYGVGMLAYIVVILPSPSSWSQSNSPFVAWAGLVVLYALIGVALYGFARWLEARDANRSFLSHGSDENPVASVDAPEAETPPALSAG